MGLVDLPELGNKFSWFNLNGDLMSRLDHFLVSDGLIDLWGLKAQFIENISFSGHYPISIKSNKLDWGPKPFKLFSAWIDHLEFLPFVEEVWSATSIQSQKLFYFKEKPKILKVG